MGAFELEMREGHSNAETATFRRTSRLHAAKHTYVLDEIKPRPLEGVRDRRCKDRNAERKIPGQFGVQRRAAERPLRLEGSIIRG